MRARVNIILEESILAKIDAIAGDKPKRAAVIEKALLEFIAREESKGVANPKAETVAEKAGSKIKRAKV